MRHKHGKLCIAKFRDVRTQLLVSRRAQTGRGVVHANAVDELTAIQLFVLVLHAVVARLPVAKRRVPPAFNERFARVAHNEVLVWRVLRTVWIHMCM